MPKPYPTEFRRNVVAVARQGGSISSIARGFGITDSCLRNWVKQADAEDGVRPGTTSAEAEQVRDLKPQRPLREGRGHSIGQTHLGVRDAVTSENSPDAHAVRGGEYTLDALGGRALVFEAAKDGLTASSSP